MMEVQVKVNFDKRAAKARILAGANDALAVLGTQVLSDMTKHVPKDQGALRNSGISTSSRTAVNLEYVLRWDEPYAQYLFHGEVMYGNPMERTYGPAKLKFTEALARMEWTKYAAKVYGKDWKRVYQAELRRRLRER